jgi:hypothetical protein
MCPLQSDFKYHSQTVWAGRHAYFYFLSQNMHHALKEINFFLGMDNFGGSVG